jgi:NADH dehydrogenase FAD-containing subunit
VRTILIVGCGYVGCYTAWKLAKKPRRGEARAHKTVIVRPALGDSYPLGYDIIVVTAGAVTRTLAIPGVTEHALTPVQHPRVAFLAGAGPRVSAPDRGAGAVEARVLAGDAPRS